MNSKLDPVTGVLSRDELKALAEAPYGAALKAIREHDPLWGRQSGEMIDWDITFQSNIRGYAMVKAVSREVAEEIAQELESYKIAWDEPVDFDIEIEDVRPAAIKPEGD